MKSVKANVLKRDKFLIALGGLYSAPVCVYAFLLFKRLSEYGADAADLAAIPVTAVLAVVFMPLIYDAINSSVIVTAGRYHLPLALAALAAPLSFVLMFSYEEIFTRGVNSALFCICLPVSVLSMLTLFYLYGSIRERIIDPKDKNNFALTSVFAFLGAALSVAALFLLDKFMVEGAAAGAQFAGILLLIAAAGVYFGSAPYMPRLIRLEKPRKKKPKEKYARFFAPFFNKRKLPSALGYFLCTAAAVIFLLLLEFMATDIFKLGADYFYYAAGALAVSFTLAFFGAEKIISGKNQFALKLIAAGLICMAAAYAIFGLYVDFGQLTAALYILSAVFVGAAAGAVRSVRNFNMEDVMMNASVTGGIARNFYNILFVIAFALAAVVTFIPLQVSGQGGLVVTFSFAAALALGFAVTAFLVKKEESLTMNAVDFITETRIADDIDRYKL